MKRQISTIIFFLLLLAHLGTQTRTVEAAPVTPGLFVTVVPHELLPAQAGYVHIGGSYPLQVIVKLDGDPLDVFWTGEGYRAVFAFNFDEPPGEHTLSIDAVDPATGIDLSRTDKITVMDFQYPREPVSVPYRLWALLDPEINQSELDKLNAIYAVHTYPSRWDWPFSTPVPGGVITSRFGGARVYNGGMWTAHHTGTDFRRAIGEPVHSTADGYVVTAEMFDVRGNVVIIDHGYGVFSQYAHLSEFYVQPGQFIRRGQVVGAAGATGRTNGPHLHFEIIVNGIPVDPIRWLALAPGFIYPPEVPPNQD